LLFVVIKKILRFLKRQILFLDLIILPIQAIWETYYLLKNLPHESRVIIINSNASFGWQVATLAYTRDLFRNYKILNLQIKNKRINKLVYKAFGNNFSQILYSPWSVRINYRRGLDILIKAFFQFSILVFKLKIPPGEDEFSYSILIYHELFKIQRPKEQQQFVTLKKGKHFIKKRSHDIFRINNLPRNEIDRLILPDNMRSIAKKIIREIKPEFNFDDFILINDRKARSLNESDKIRESKFENYSLLIDQIIKEKKSIAIYSSKIDNKIINLDNPKILDASKINNENELINIFLLTECKKIISQNCGAIIVPWLANIPIMTVDHFPLFIELSKEHDIVIPLKFKFKGKYVSFKDIIKKYPSLFQTSSSSTLPKDFEVEHNTSTDILNAYKKLYLTRYANFPKEAVYLKRGKAYFYDYTLIN